MTPAHPYSDNTSVTPSNRADRAGTDSLSPQHTRFDIWAQVMVREGKVVVHAPNHPRRLKALPVEETQLRLGVISPPVYHRRIVVDPSPELRFGLPADMPIEQVRQITDYCPPVRLGGLARTIPDRRTLRGALIDWRGEQWLIVEADLGVLWRPSSALGVADKAAGCPGTASFAATSAQRAASQVRENHRPRGHRAVPGNQRNLPHRRRTPQPAARCR